MTELLTDKQIEQAYRDYLKDNKKVVDQMIAKKIETATKSAINQAFATGNGYGDSEGWARKLVYSLVDEKVSAATTAQTVVVDLDEIQEKVNASLKRHLNKLNVKVEM